MWQKPNDNKLLGIILENTKMSLTYFQLVYDMRWQCAKTSSQS